MTEDHETIENEERGCGFLKHGKAYLKSPSRSGAGTLPPIVRFDPPVPYLERAKFRGYEFFPGTEFELAVTSGTDVPLTGAEWFSPKGDEDPRFEDGPDPIVGEHEHARNAVSSHNGADAGITRTDPPGEVWRHIARLTGSADGEHAGDITAFHAPDLFMHVGKCYYETPEEFLEEVEEQGLSKAIPVSESQEPPRVNPGKTRLFLVHPTAIDEDTAGVIGYVYLERSVYTEDKEGRFPGWAKQMSGGREDMDLVHVGDQIHSDGTRATKVNGEWTEVAEKDHEPAGDETDEDDDSSGSSAESVRPSDKPGRDVEAVPTDDYTADEDARPKCYDCESRIDEFENDGNGSPVCPECGGNPLPPVGSSDDEDDRLDLFYSRLKDDLGEFGLSGWKEFREAVEIVDLPPAVEFPDEPAAVNHALVELELREEDYNSLRSRASALDLNPGRNPSADDLVQVLLDDMGAI